jgi:acyl-CoA synthetase (AMP-forming)/AMP-acid ligase II
MAVDHDDGDRLPCAPDDRRVRPVEPVGIRGGGAAMPEALCVKLKALTGLDYVEGYGMSETMAATHLNAPQRPILAPP